MKNSPTPAQPTAPRFSRLRRSTCDPQCSSGVDAHVCCMASVNKYTSVIGQKYRYTCAGSAGAALVSQFEYRPMPDGTD